jgi:tetratricopeptide (TPR) repeat protein
MTLAAISLMLHRPAIAEHVAYLQAEHAKASEKDKTKLDLALAAAYRQLQDWSHLQEVAARLLAGNPTSDTAFQLMASACLGLKDWPAWEKAIAARQARLPNDLVTLRSSASLASSRGDFARARSVLRGVIDSGKGNLADINNYSWFALFLDKVDPDDVSGLEHAITSSPNNTGFAPLHTLACLYATTGKGKEARDLLLKAMETAGYEEPDSEVWFGLGSIAQQYGLTDAAVADYRKVEKPKIFDLPDSSYQLAQRRLQELGPHSSVITMAEQELRP